jgi:hypothetical protein
MAQRGDAAGAGAPPAGPRGPRGPAPRLMLTPPATPQLMVPAESAHDTIGALGDVGLLQFKDLNADKSAFQRTYANQVGARGRAGGPACRSARGRRVRRSGAPQRAAPAAQRLDPRAPARARRRRRRRRRSSAATRWRARSGSSTTRCGPPPLVIRSCARARANLQSAAARRPAAPRSAPRPDRPLPRRRRRRRLRRPAWRWGCARCRTRPTTWTSSRCGGGAMRHAAAASGARAAARLSARPSRPVRAATGSRYILQLTALSAPRRPCASTHPPRPSWRSWRPRCSRSTATASA